MALSERDKERINLMNPVANDVKLGDILQEAGGGGGAVDAYTKAEADGKFQQKGDYATKAQVDVKADKGASYTKAESDNKYQAKGTYVAKADFDALAARVKALEDAGGGS